MCGIFGIISNNKELKSIEYRDAVKHLFLLSESRGKEASGFATIQDENIYVYKTPYPASKLIKSGTFKKYFSKDAGNQLKLTIGHSRLVTNGYEHFNKNNQPVIKNGIVAIHNGIIVNQKKLWEKYADEEKLTDLDSELIPTLLKRYLNTGMSIGKSLKSLYSEIYGMTSIALLFEDYKNLILATNNGSLYYISSEKSDIFIFASEFYILKELIRKVNLGKSIFPYEIKHLEPNSSLSFNFENSILSIIDFCEEKDYTNEEKFEKIFTINEIYENKDKSNFYINKSLEHNEINIPEEFANHYEDVKNKVNNLRRCTKCILPETFPFIEFDENGICNYCRSYERINYSGKENLFKFVEQYRRNDGKPECLVPFSGGRDSSFTLHFIKKELGLKPIAFSYDWGMITDLARRNQARMCGKLGVEHILVSADIRKKRENIRKNVLAWLKRPNLGIIPLFMAGDKQYFYYSKLLKKQNGIKIDIMGENYLEKTMFKTAFSGAKQEKSGFMAYHISTLNKLRMLFFYFKEYTLNPAYMNSSVWDTMGAFFSLYATKHDYLNLFDFIEWDEKIITDTLLNEYAWETDPGTKTTWRIGDGTAAFYNYIYYIVAGFTENDTFRSNQIREGDLAREEALRMSAEENKPRWDSIKWYCDTINISFEETIKVINNTKKLF